MGKGLFEKLNDMKSSAAKPKEKKSDPYSYWDKIVTGKGFKQSIQCWVLTCQTVEDFEDLIIYSLKCIHFLFNESINL